MDESKITKMTHAVHDSKYANIHSILIAKNNKLVYEEYFSGKDATWAEGDVGVVNFTKDSLHDARSISKSIISACIGIAIHQRLIKSVHQRILDFFPEYASLLIGTKKTITIENLLTMSDGLEWNENIIYSDTMNSEIQMYNSPDPVAYILGRNLVHAPGKQWNYNSGSVTLLGAIIQKVSGMNTDIYADKYLFQPLGINEYYWNKLPNSKIKDAPAYASGLRLKPRDMLKFGLLYKNNGRLNGHQIIAEKWVDNSLQNNIKRKNPDQAYGYLFWMQNDIYSEKEIKLSVAVGFGGQRIYIDKKNNLVIVITAGNYDDWKGEFKTDRIIYDYVYPSLKK